MDYLAVYIYNYQNLPSKISK